MKQMAHEPIIWLDSRIGSFRKWRRPAIRVAWFILHEMRLKLAAA